MKDEEKERYIKMLSERFPTQDAYDREYLGDFSTTNKKPPDYLMRALEGENILYLEHNFWIAEEKQHKLLHDFPELIESSIVEIRQRRIDFIQSGGSIAFHSGKAVDARLFAGIIYSHIENKHLIPPRIAWELDI